MAPDIAGVGRGLQIRTQSGQAQVAIVEHERLARHQEKPSAGHRHHGVPHQPDGRAGQLQLGEALPPAQPVNAGRLHQFVRNILGGRVHAEGHVPHLAGEDQQDGAELHAELPRGKQRHHGHHHGRQKTQHRDGLQGVEQRNQDALGAGVVRGELAIGDGKDQADEVGGEDPRHREERVLGQHAGVQLDVRLRVDRRGPVVAQRDQAVEQRQPANDDGQVAQQRPRRGGRKFAVPVRPLPSCQGPS